MVSGDAYFRFILADGCLGASNASSRPLLIIFFLINKYWWGGGRKHYQCHSSHLGQFCSHGIDVKGIHYVQKH